MISSLIRLILLPIVILRVFVWKFVWHFVYFFLRKPIRLLIAAALVGLAILFGVVPSFDGSSSSSPSSKKPNTSTAGSKIRPDGHPASHPAPPEALPEITSRIRNGNDAFTGSLIKKMEDHERSYYTLEFHHAMYYSRPGVPYLWKNSSGSMFGRIDAEKAIKASSGLYCRKYREFLNYKENAVTLRGYACQNRKGGWCRVSLHGAKTCGIERPTGWKGFKLDLKQSLQRMF